MSETIAKRIISFSPPDISEFEITEVVEALRSGQITIGTRTKILEYRLTVCIEMRNTDVDCTTNEAIIKYSQKGCVFKQCYDSETTEFACVGVLRGR